ncbi:MAG TPA: hypothetical protein VE907_04465 [Gammaproteobacteria bacterium]|nr:hypothetical protein [Gammaproteobacteria bacterium]
MSALGFELIGDPSRLLNPYRLTAASYKSARNLFVTVGFDPADSNSAAISCGRQWRAKRGGSLLSNRYSSLAKRFGIDVPDYYELGYGDNIVKTMERMLDDLRETLPVVMERTTCEDLIAVESKKYGACHSAAAHAGEDYMKHYDIADY